MAKNRTAQADQREPTATSVTVESRAFDTTAYGLVGDIVFDPPLSPEEQRQRYGLGMTMEERILWLDVRSPSHRIHLSRPSTSADLRSGFLQPWPATAFRDPP
jgi:hypothetical protein